MSIRVRYDGAVFIPVDPVDLAPGEVVSIELTRPNPSFPQSGESIVGALAQLPRPKAEDVAELERLIKEGQRPRTVGGIFDAEAEGSAA
jgi:predicted DNA-binding antitoxin AbrB/MazE fold protein